MLHLLFLCPLLFAYSSFGFIFFVTQYNCTAVLGSPGEVRGFRGRWGWVGECEEVYPRAFHSFGVLAVQIHCWRRPCPLLQGKWLIGKKETISLEYRSIIKPGTVIALDCVLCRASFYFPLKSFRWFDLNLRRETKRHCISTHMFWKFSGSSMILGGADAYSLLNTIMIEARYSRPVNHARANHVIVDCFNCSCFWKC